MCIVVYTIFALVCILFHNILICFLIFLYNIMHDVCLFVSVLITILYFMAIDVFIINIITSD